MTIFLDFEPKGMLWDLDNTLYRVDEVMEQAYNIAVAKAAIEWGVNLSFDDAVVLADRSWKEHRYSARVFLEQFNIPKEDLHFLLNKYTRTDLIEKCNETFSIFQESKIPHALITHSSRSWAIRVLRNIDLLSWFPDTQVFGYEDYHFESKHKSRKSFEMALQSINRDPQDCVMVEDTIENLSIPHDMGMKTVYVHHGKMPENLPNFVDDHCVNALDLMRKIYSKASG